MSAYTVVGLVGAVVVAGAVLGIAAIVRSGVRHARRYPAPPPEPRCPGCGHGVSHHAGGVCRAQVAGGRRWWNHDEWVWDTKNCGCTRRP
ncbi:hypothetical protein ABT001_04690 [Streptomyces sp. NPDC002793]|uniref:hypothetical protein n=1 Tax=Streptomyces sp. NPDC002793 TaxID=3154432 RepID=UPI00331D7C0B